MYRAGKVNTWLQLAVESALSGKRVAVVTTKRRELETRRRLRDIRKVKPANLRVIAV